MTTSPSPTKPNRAWHIEPVRYHPFGTTYVGYQLSVWLIRALASINLFFARRSQFRTIPKSVTKRTILVPSRDRGRTITVDVYERTGSGPPAKPAPVHLNFHGSGYILPGLGTDAEFCGWLANRDGIDGRSIIVLDCDYRKAPEHPYPAAFQDAQDVLTFVSAQPDVYDLARITLSGFSAGGNLAVTLSTTTSIAGVCCFYGSADLSKRIDAPSQESECGVTISHSMRNYFYRCYLLPDIPPTYPEVSPSYAPTESFPRHVYWAMGEADNLYVPGEELIQRLHREGHPDATFLTFPKMAHGFDKSAKPGTAAWDEKWKMYQAAGEMIDRAQTVSTK